MLNKTNKEQFDFSYLREDFPLLKQLNRGKPIIYLDSAASAQKPKVVIDRISDFYQKEYANIHRGIYELSERATELYEQVRSQIKDFIHAKHNEEIVFVRGTTEAINLVAQSYSKSTNPFQSAPWKAGDEVILSVMEHHSNIVPWYLLKEQIGLQLKVIPMQADGSLDIDAYQQLFSTRTKLVAVSHVSNALGTINPVKNMTRIAHEHQVPVLLDGAQAIPHLPVNVEDIDCDFYTFSGHKIYGPTGVGVLYGKKNLLDSMPPYQGGGDMIETVSFSKVTFAKTPHQFEAGTQDLASVIGLSTALEYVSQIGMQHICEHEETLLQYAEPRLLDIPGLHIIGAIQPKVGVISFIMDGIHPHDLGTVLDHEGIAIRAGHHCAMPLMEYLEVPATVRASFGIYTNHKDIDALIHAIQLAKRLFRQ